MCFHRGRPLHGKAPNRNGSSTAAQWRDLLQSRRQFWTALTTRHASLVPLCADALQRERRQMQSKHLWYSIDISWLELDRKLQVLAPTGLTREQTWQHLFLTKHRQNPFVEGRYKGADYIFFFSNAVRTITALTVLRSGRKLRHLDNVGSLTKQNKHKTHPKQTKPNTTNQKASQKARTKVKRCETCGNATLKLSRVLLQEIVPNNIWRHIQNCSVPTTCCASLTHLEAFSKRWLPPAQNWFHPFDR